MAVDILDEVTLEERASAQPVFLSEAVSGAVADMIKSVSPSVVQVQSHGRGGGAGIIWRSDGAILTNFHVVANSRGPIEVLLPDGRRYETKVVTANPELDLALLKADATDLPAAPVADSSHLRVGELVFAIGHPWGQPWVVTAGIVSAVGSIPVGRGGREAQYIRSDVSLAPGNSGGPMLNAQGAVIGISAMIFGGDLSVGIPSHVAADWVAGLPSRRVYLGVGIQPVEVAAEEIGLMVVALEPDSPAQKAGVLVGDVLMAVGDEPVGDPDALFKALSHRSAGEKVALGVVRAGRRQSLDVELGAREPLI